MKWMSFSLLFAMVLCFAVVAAKSMDSDEKAGEPALPQGNEGDDAEEELAQELNAIADKLTEAEQDLIDNTCESRNKPDGAGSPRSRQKRQKAGEPALPQGNEGGDAEEELAQELNAIADKLTEAEQDLIDTTCESRNKSDRAGSPRSRQKRQSSCSVNCRRGSCSCSEKYEACRCYCTPVLKRPKCQSSCSVSCRRGSCSCNERYAACHCRCTAILKRPKCRAY